MCQKSSVVVPLDFFFVSKKYLNTIELQILIWKDNKDLCKTHYYGNNLVTSYPVFCIIVCGYLYIP